MQQFVLDSSVKAYVSSSDQVRGEINVPAGDVWVVVSQDPVERPNGYAPGETVVDIAPISGVGHPVSTNTVLVRTRYGLTPLGQALRKQRII